MNELLEQMKKLLQAAYDLGYEEGKNRQAKPKVRGTADASQCLFEMSRWAEFKDFATCFTDEEYKDIDIFYYYMAVKDWSAGNGAKKKDWIATTRNFMRADKDKGKLHTIRREQDGNLFDLLEKERQIYG